MPTAEVAADWSTALEAIGGGLIFWFSLFTSNYRRKREEVRAEANRSEEVAATAIGAAFPVVDRTATNALVEICENTKKICKMLREKFEHDEEVEQEEEAARKLQERTDRALALIDEAAAKKLRDAGVPIGENRPSGG